MIAADLTNVEVWVATTPVDMRKSFDGAWQYLTLNASSRFRRCGAFADLADFQLR
jgi:hypothetical protein